MDGNYRRASFDSGSLHSRFRSNISGDRYFPLSDFYPSSSNTGRILQSELSSYGTDESIPNYWIRVPSVSSSDSKSPNKGEPNRKSGTTGTFSYFSPDSPRLRLRRYDQVQYDWDYCIFRHLLMSIFDFILCWHKSCLSNLVQNQKISNTYVVPYLAKGKTVWTVLGTFADVTSIQGVPYMKKANRWWSTLFWIIIFGIACTACVLHIGYLSMQYLDYSTSSKTDIGFTNLEFPSVTVCNMNPIRYSKLDESTAEMQNFINQIEQSEQNAEIGNRKKVHTFLYFHICRINMRRNIMILLGLQRLRLKAYIVIYFALIYSDS